MDKTMVDSLTAKVAQDETILAFDKSLLDLAVNGWKTDTDAQMRAITDAIAPLNNKIATLEATVEGVKIAITQEVK